MKMKKFINAPETITDEELVGLGLANPDILYVDGHLVISRDLAKADRVTVVTYGGSGHEPAQAGFVGKGMLDVQAVGDIFAAPNPQLVFDAMKADGIKPVKLIDVFGDTTDENSHNRETGLRRAMKDSGYEKLPVVTVDCGRWEPDVAMIVSKLSGGNQQKVIIAKWFLKDPDILFMDEPTKGVDIGAKAEIQNLIFEKSEKGMSFVIISSELEEIMSLCDRIIVICEGRLVGEVSKSDFSKDSLMKGIVSQEENHAD